MTKISVLCCDGQRIYLHVILISYCESSVKLFHSSCKHTQNKITTIHNKISCITYNSCSSQILLRYLCLVIYQLFHIIINIQLSASYDVDEAILWFHKMGLVKFYPVLLKRYIQQIHYNNCNPFLSSQIVLQLNMYFNTLRILV